MQPTAEQFTEKAWAAIVSAQQIAQTSRHQQLETEHLLLALLQQNGLAGRILKKSGIDPATIQAAVESHLKRQPNMGSPPEKEIIDSLVRKGLALSVSAGGELERSCWMAVSYTHLTLPTKRIV